MTGGRVEPFGVAQTYGQGEADERAGTWERSGTWEGAETWDYDEARANPEAYDLLELRLMRDREEGPRFDRFQAALADTPPVAGDQDLPLSVCPPDDATLLEAVKTGRFWSSALWLVGAASAGVLAGLVSTNFVALALNPSPSSVLAEQLAAPSAAARSAGSAAAPWAVTTLAQASARPAPSGDPVVTSTPVGSRAPTVADPAPSDLPSATIEIATREAEPLPALLVADPPRAAQAVPKTMTAPAPAALRLAALVEPAPGVPAPALATPIERPTPAAAATAKAPADQADQQRAPAPPAAASAARVTTPPAPATSRAPTEEYRVQLAMLRDKQNIKYVLHDFVAQFGPSAKDLKRYVFPTQTAHGTRHLVQVGPFADEDHAQAMCSKLKQRGGDCLVVHQPS